MLIDLHAHALTDGMLGRAGRWGPEWVFDADGYRHLRVGEWVLSSSTEKRRVEAGEQYDAVDRRSLSDPRARIALMDRYGIDQMVLSLPVHCVLYWAEPEVAVPFARVVNEELAAYAADEPDRLHFWGHLPLQEPASAVVEADRAVTQLGAKGFAVGGANLGGREFDEPAFFPLWEKVCELDVPLFVHGFTQAEARGDAGRHDRYDLTTIIGFMYDETSCFLNLVCGGVLDRFPHLAVYITHGGGFVPYQLSRLEMMIAAITDGKNEKPCREYLDNFYFDLLLHDVPMRRAVVDQIGVDRLVYGDNFNGSEWRADEDLTSGLGLTDAELEKIRSTNARRLLKL